MVNAAPHYLLISESQSQSTTRNEGGRWRFVLEQIGGDEKLVVADSEPDVSGERLQLLTVIRGLEALDQPSRVTLLTPSKYVSRGIRRGLPHWRENDWQWERYGQMCKINDDDLWQRLDRALQLHRVDCRNWRLMASTLEQESPTKPTIVESPPVVETELSNPHSIPDNHEVHGAEIPMTSTDRLSIYHGEQVEFEESAKVSEAESQVKQTTLQKRSQLGRWIQSWNKVVSAVPLLIL